MTQKNIFNPRFRFLHFLFMALLMCLGGVALATEAEERQTAHQRLADLLEDDATRTVLIEQLRRLGEDEAASALANDQSTTLAGQIAGVSQSVARAVSDEAGAAFDSLGASLTRILDADPVELGWALGEFAVLVAVTLAVFWLAGKVVGSGYAALDRYAGRVARSVVLMWARRLIAVTGAAALDVAVIAFAWISGYGIALFVLGAPGEINLQESLFLNAFLVVEAVRMVLRAVLARRGEHMRLLPVSAEEKAYWYIWSSRMVFFLGYGLMLLVPLINRFLTPELGRAVAILIMLFALLKGAVITLQNRKRGREALDRLAQRMQTSFARVSIGFGARIWHVVLIAYLSAILGTAILYPEQALPFMVGATLQTLIAVVVGIALAALLSQVILRRIQLNDDLRTRFPLLEARLNAYVPTALKIARFVILALVVAFIVDAWTPFDLGAWMASDAGAHMIGRVFSVAVIIVLALTVWLLVASWIEFRLNPLAGDGEPNPRARTLLTIFRNAVAIALVVVTVMVVLAEIGLNIAPLLAGAGVLGLAIGFGAQKLVQDVITGVFIQLENAINVGDVVTAAGTTGVVERMTIRSLGLRDLSGTYHLLPFSSVATVSNYSREFGFHVGEYGVAYREDTDEVIVHLRAAFAELLENPDLRGQILSDELEVHGVTALADSSVNVRVRIKTIAGSQFSIGREYNRLVKRHFDAAGIEIPFPHMTLYFGEDKRGEAPPARVSMIHPAPRKPEPATVIDAEEARPNPEHKGDFDEARD